MDRFRELRHEDLYELEFFATKEDVKEAFKNAEFVIKEYRKTNPLNKKYAKKIIQNKLLSSNQGHLRSFATC
ncbi:MAG: hypothetical protein QXL14_01660 [Candidatus Aenigmatarchaeota archaeon]